MKKPLILFISLLIAIGIGFYIYQSTQTKPSFQEVTIVDNEEATESVPSEDPDVEVEENEEEEIVEEEEPQPSPFSDFIVKVDKTRFNSSQIGKQRLQQLATR